LEPRFTWCPREVPPQQEILGGWEGETSVEKWLPAARW
jgi:hypothetical protein